MNKEHTETLWGLAPILYGGRKKSIKENLMPFGFECGDGWFLPIRDLSIKLEAHNIMLKPFNLKIEATQVKEKYATLRFYYMVLPTDDEYYDPERVLSPEEEEKLGEQEVMMNYANLITDELVDKAEEECKHYCEECGEQFYPWDMSKRVMTTGWYRIVCRDCAQKNNWPHLPYPDDNKDPLAEEENKLYRKEENKQ